ncbi:MAG: alkaline shock response membrane anchor protein AmaP [Actinomycetota bacterium]|nr:alkaline shock response membrane anchor protein AmaP [Actinomycetota bacterium]
MLRQRLRTRTSALAVIGRLLVGLLACALVFFGAMLLLLSLKVSAATVNGISGFRDAYDYLAGLEEEDLSQTARYVAGGAGLLAFFAFGYLALKEIPRPYLARHDLELSSDERGVVTIEPRAIERVAEATALRHHAVAGAAGRYGDDEIVVGLSVGQARDTATTLHEVQAAIAEALQRHGLPAMPIHLTLTGFERRTQRELN